MGNLAPLLVIGALLLVFVFLSNRSKAKRATEDAARRKAIVPGTRVMTTSGMYGTVVAIDPANDGGQADTVVLEIAPGTEVTWALAAVREAPVRVEVTDDALTEPALDPAPDRADDVDLDASAEPGARTPVRMVKPKGRSAEH